MGISLFEVTALSTCLAAAWSIYEHMLSKKSDGAMAKLPTQVALAEHLAAVTQSVQPFVPHIALLAIEHRLDPQAAPENKLITNQMIDRLRSRLAGRDHLARDSESSLLYITHEVHPDAWLADTQALCNELMEALTPAYDCDSGSFGVGTSIGASIYPIHGDGEHLIRKSVIALNAGKRFGEGSSTIYSAGLERGKAIAESPTVPELRDGLANCEYALYFAPTMHVIKGYMTGADALLRWKRSDGKLLPASQFVEIPDHPTLTIEIWQWLIDEACYNVAHLKRKGVPRMHVAVHVPQVVLQDKNLVAMVTRSLERHRIDGEALEFVIPEFALQQKRIPKKALGELSILGIRLTVSNVGNAAQSLDYLEELSITGIRLTGAQSRMEEVAVSLVRVADQFSLETTAEGVDSVASLEHLRTCGCAHAQGKVFSRPLTVDALIEFLRDFDYSTATETTQDTSHSNVHVLIT
ncbi:MAG: EAL domain-containing protein [Rhodocyclaceae bacterium]|nr:EAL domain-containing protein [Rhodocyclaceae bacterium]